MAVLEEYYDAVVIGAGHAGCEAALACARLGLETIVFTVSVESIATFRYASVQGTICFWYKFVWFFCIDGDY